MSQLESNEAGLFQRRAASFHATSLGLLVAAALALAGCGVGETELEPEDDQTLSVALEGSITEFKYSNTDTTVSYQFKYSTGSNYYQIVIDTDGKSTTGYTGFSGMGGDYLLQNGDAFRYTGTGSNWSFSKVGSITFSASSGLAKFTVDRKLIGETSLCGETSLVKPRIGDSTGKTIGSTPPITQSYTKSSTCSPSPAPAPSTRNPYLEPFSSDSIWNTAIGSGAQFTSVKVSSSWPDTSWAKIPGTDQNLLFFTPTAPLTSIYYSSAGWSGADRCAPTSSTILAKVPMPSGYVVPNGRSNSSAAFLLADGRTLKQVQPLARCTAGGNGTALVGFTNVDLYGDGIRGAHGGSGMSAIGGTLRIGELRPGQSGPRHALSMTLYMKEAFRCTTQTDCYRWPAVRADSYAVGWYGTATNNPNAGNKAYRMGALFAIPGSVSLSSLGLETVPGRQLAWTLQNYGGYVIDDSKGASFYFTTEKGPAGDFLEQFYKDYGFEFVQKQSAIDANATAWVRDVRKLISVLQIVNNNSATSIGGGGTPRVQRKPDIYP